MGQHSAHTTWLRQIGGVRRRGERREPLTADQVWYYSTVLGIAATGVSAIVFIVVLLLAV